MKIDLANIDSGVSTDIQKLLLRAFNDGIDNDIPLCYGKKIKLETAVEGVYVEVYVNVDGKIVMPSITLGTPAAKLAVASTKFVSSGYATLTDGQSEGLMGYLEGHIAGTTIGHIYNFGSWINVDAAAVLGAGHIVVPFEGGVYTSEAQASARIVFAGQYQAILEGAPASLHAWRLNTTQAITALIAAANAGSVGYAASAGVASNKVGDIPIADIVGHGVRYIRLYDGPA